MPARKLIFVTLIALAVIGSVIWLFLPGERHYQGKTLRFGLINFRATMATQLSRHCATSAQTQ
jgi:hypothetical protein